MRILAISNEYPPNHSGGYATFCQRILAGLAERGHQCSILTTPGRAFHLPRPGTHVEADGVRAIRELAWTEAVSPTQLWRNTLHNRRAADRAIRDTRPDLIYVFTLDEVGCELLITALESGVPVAIGLADTWLAQAFSDLPRFDPFTGLVTSRGGNPIKSLGRALLRALARAQGLSAPLELRVCPPVHAISEFVLHRLKASGAAVEPWCRAIHPIIPEEYFATSEPARRPPRSDGPLRALFLSRVEMLKGPDTAIEGVAAARRAGCDVRLTIGGVQDSAIQAELDAMARRLNVAAQLTWSDWASTEPIPLYRESDVLLFPSRIIEGLGQVIVEAGALGVPTLGTVATGSREVIREGVTGFGFEADDAETLGRLICRLDQDRALLQRLGEGARAMAEEFRREPVLDAVEQFLQRVLKDAAGR